MDEILLYLTPFQITVGERQRSLDPKAVEALRLSIAAIGLKTPISVRLIDEERGYALVSGAHRLQACVDLGMQSIPAREETGTELDAKLWEIAENLHRADLTVLERAEHIAEWIRLTEDARKIQRPETGPLEKQVGYKTPPPQPAGGIKGAARELGIERHEAQRAATIAGLAPAVRDAAVDLKLDDNQSALLAAAKAPTPAAQVAVLQQIKARKATPKPPPEPPTPITKIPLPATAAVKEVQRAIEALTQDELRAFTDWFDDYIENGLF